MSFGRISALNGVMNGYDLGKTFRAINDVGKFYDTGKTFRAINDVGKLYDTGKTIRAINDVGKLYDTGKTIRAIGVNAFTGPTTISDAIKSVNAFTGPTTITDAIKSFNAFTGPTTISDAIKSFNAFASPTTINDAIMHPGFASFHDAIQYGVQNAATAVNLSAEPSVEETPAIIGSWRPTKEQARSSVDLVTFLIALVWFAFASTDVSVPEPVKDGVVALLAFAVVLSRYAR